MTKRARLKWLRRREWLYAGAVIGLGYVALSIVNGAHQRVRGESAAASAKLLSRSHFEPNHRHSRSAAGELEISWTLPPVVAPEPEALEPEPEPTPYAGPIFAPKLDGPTHRVKSLMKSPEPEVESLRSREVEVTQLPYFKKKAEARAETIRKMGENLERAKKTAAALGYYRQVVRDFPHTPAAERAGDRLAALAR